MTTRVTLRPGAADLFAAWQSTFTRTAAEADGFLALDMTPAFAGAADWQVVQRFRSAEALARWRGAGARARLLADLAALCAAASDDAMTQAADPPGAVTEVITTVVEPGKVEEFLGWAERIQARQATFPGYMGTLVQAPVSAEMPYWTTLVRFSTPAQLDAWLGSAERRELLRRADPAVSRWRSYRLQTPFAGWFPAADTLPPPPAWKQAALVLLVLFPVVMLEIRFLSPLLAGLHLAVATFIGNAISVALTSWPLMQIAVAGMGWWLQPAPARRRQREALGAGTMILLYAIELSLAMLLA